MEFAWVVTITNGAREEVEHVPTKYATTADLAEGMVAGLINKEWEVLPHKTHLTILNGEAK